MSTIPTTTVQPKDNHTVTLRTAQPEDAAMLLELVHGILAEGEFVLSTLDDFRMTEEKEAAWIQANLDNPGNVVIVAEDDGKIIGMINFHSEERKRVRHHGELSMSVHEAWRDKGVGLL